MREGWVYKKLGELATFINGYPFKKHINRKNCRRFTVMFLKITLRTERLRQKKA